MRLIDADKLKKKIRHWNYNATTSTPTFSFVTEEDIDYMPTVCDLEQIRNEIERLNCEYIDYNTGCGCSAYVSQNDVLQIINNHTKGDN